MKHQMYDANVLIPLAQRDRELEELWAELEDIPFDEDEDGRLILSEDWLHFPKGTWNEEIWKWFDQRYSGGVFNLMYPSQRRLNRMKDLTAAMYYTVLCDECETKSCAYNSSGECRYPLVHHAAPIITEEEGCMSGVFDIWS